MPRAKAPTVESQTLILEPEDNERLANLCGPFDEHLREVELRVGVEIANRGNLFKVSGAPEAVRAAERLLRFDWRRRHRSKLETRPRRIPGQGGFSSHPSAHGTRNAR